MSREPGVAATGGPITDAAVRSRSAVVRELRGGYVVEDVLVGPAGPGEVLVRVQACGLCHTDAIARSGLGGAGFFPAVLGHEGAGVVVAVGPGVEHLAPGTTVVLSFDSCGRCAPCRAGRPSYCVEFLERNIGGRGIDDRVAIRDAGGAPLTSRWFGQSSFGEFAIATARNCVPVEDDLPPEILAPLGCGFLTGAGTVLVELDLRAGETLAVFGVGAVGLSAILAAKARGAAEIVAVDVQPARLAVAERLGATRVVDGTAPDLVQAVRAGTSGLDATFDTTGRASVMAAAVESLGMGGRSALCAATDELTVRPQALVGRSLTYVREGSADPHTLIPELVRMWRAGAFPVDSLVRTYGLDELDEAERDAASGAVVKPVILLPAAARPPGGPGVAAGPALS